MRTNEIILSIMTVMVDGNSETSNDYFTGEHTLAIWRGIREQGYNDIDLLGCTVELVGLDGRHRHIAMTFPTRTWAGAFRDTSAWWEMPANVLSYDDNGHWRRMSREMESEILFGAEEVREHKIHLLMFAVIEAAYTRTMKANEPEVLTIDAPQYPHDPIKDLAAIRGALYVADALDAEVILSAMYALQECPEISVESAITIGINNWIK